MTSKTAQTTHLSAPSSSLLDPRYCIHEPYEKSLSPLVVTLADQANVTFADWQLRDLEIIAAVDEQLQFVQRIIGLAIPRQNGKTTIIMWYSIMLAMVFGARILWTAHNYSTTMKTLEDFRNILGTKVHDSVRGIRYFNDRLCRVSSKTAQESYTFKPYAADKNEGFIAFSTRTKTANLGNTFDIVVIDEAQELLPEHVQALLPTTSSGPMENPQYIYMGTPRRAGSVADKFEKMRSRALAGTDVENTCWIEYGLEEVGDVSDESRWYKAAPSLAAGIVNVTALREIRKQMDDLQFAQECLGVWLTPQELAGGAGAPLIDKETWDACKTHCAPQGKPTAYGVKFSVDGTYFAVCVAVKEDDHIHVELVDKRASIGGKKALADFVTKRAQTVPVVIDGKAGAESLIKRIGEAAPEENLISPTPADLVTANVDFVDAVSEQTLTWYEPDILDEDEEDELTKAITQSYKRPIGRTGGWGFDGEGAAVAEAATLAFWMASQVEDEEAGEVYF
ncbi:terminase large subunit [Atopobium sp. oral taxon 199]|uniref:terminase large subunit n=1 Tax=Atopobium sp. oral taxon 199 TaxID=712156 RepID=UPI0012EB42E9|nr:terminase large subunit [Atopobium sp. oral taxon 199]